jgi:4-coumarate--CoA ligase
VRKKDVEVSEGDVEKWIEGKLARYKWLSGGVQFVDAIPKSPSGKILKRVLRDNLTMEHQSKL